MIWAEASLFDVFTIPLVAGDPTTALTEPYSMVVSEAIAIKYFGDEDAVGKVLRADNRWDFRVTGVMRNLPSNSHMHPEIFASYSSLDAIGSSVVDTNDWAHHENFYTYLLLREGASPRLLEQQLPAFIERYAGDKFREAGVMLSPSLQALTDIHLHSHRNNEFEPNGDIQYVVLFMLIAFLIPLIACINFMNLATARSAMRTGRPDHLACRVAFIRQTENPVRRNFLLLKIISC